MAAAAVRSSCQSVFSATSRARLAWITSMAWATFLRSCGLRRTGSAACGKRRRERGIEHRMMPCRVSRRLAHASASAGDGFRAGKNLRHVNGLHARVLAVHGSAQMHEATVVESGAILGARRQHVLELDGQHGGGDLAVLHRECAAEAAAAVQIGERRRDRGRALCPAGGRAGRPGAGPRRPWQLAW